LKPQNRTFDFFTNNPENNIALWKLRKLMVFLGVSNTRNDPFFDSDLFSFPNI
jgi:hypothetical protein